MMNKKAHIIALAVMLMAAPLSIMAEPEFDGSEPEINSITLTISNGNVHVNGAPNLTLEVYNLTGVKVASYHIDNNDKHIQLNLQRGCYILKVGDVVRKISIK